MMETLIFAIILLFLNLILIYRPIPIASFVIGMFSIYIYATQMLTDSTLPVNPFFTVFLILVSTIGIIINALSMRK